MHKVHTWVVAIRGDYVHNDKKSVLGNKVEVVEEREEDKENVFWLTAFWNTRTPKRVVTRCDSLTVTSSRGTHASSIHKNHKHGTTTLYYRLHCPPLASSFFLSFPFLYISFCTFFRPSASIRLCLLSLRTSFLETSSSSSSCPLIS